VTSDPAPPEPQPGTITCPFCSVSVPDAPFCGACGAHLAAGDTGHAQRLHAYAAFPDEPVLHLSAASTLFPHLSHRAKAPFRAALGVLLALIVVFSLAGTAAPLVAVSAFGVPLVFLIYVFEVDPYESSFVLPTAVAVAVGAGLGVGWSLVANRFVNDALAPSVNGGIGSARSLVAGIAVPAVAEVLMCLTVPAVRAFQRGATESLDGFVVGATGALGFTFASTIVLLRPWLEDGQLLHGSVLSTLAQGLIRGAVWPLVSALATGFVGAAYWATIGRTTAAAGRWLTSPVLAFSLALILQCGTALASIAVLPDTELLVAEAAALAVLIVTTRIGLHHVLIHEASEATIGGPRRCGHCAKVVASMPFCPQCGVAERAVARHTRPALAAAPAPASVPTPGAAAGLAPGLGHRRLSPRLFAILLLAGVATLTVALVLVAVVEAPPPPPRCSPLGCKAPPIRPAAASSSAGMVGRLYTNRSGFGVRVFPIAGTNVYPSVAKTADAVTLTYPFRPAFGGQSQLAIVGKRDRGATPQAVVASEIAKIAPNATIGYVLPGAYVGYILGFGEVATTQVASPNGSSATYELIVIAAVSRGFEITVVAVGELLHDVGPNSPFYNGHPTPAAVNVAYVADQTVDSIRFPG
jgi:hypothetical protein